MVPTARILLAEREQNGQFSASDLPHLQFKSTITQVFTKQDLKNALQNDLVTILVIDLYFSEDDKDLTLIKTVREDYPNILIVPIIPVGQQQLLKEVMALDLFYFIHSPIDPVETCMVLKRAYESLAPKKEEMKVKQRLKKKPLPFHKMIGDSPPIRQLFDLISRVAEDDQSTVLIRGESGTGKEMVAKAIHAQSNRRDKNFVPVNCAAIPDDLLESELFGYTKGAFTGATANKPGRIQYADQGTLFLDEIGDMKSSLQAKLLRVIQEKEFEPVGAFKSIPVNTRILAATHCDLEQLVSEGKFREDLYYRLSVVPLNIPPLKERAGDIPLLIEAFFEKYADKRERERFAFSREAFAAISHYDWRGNVRELENLIQHMIILYSGRQVELADLPPKFHDVVIPPDAELPDDQYSQVEQSTEEQQQKSGTQTITWENGTVDFNELINDFETQLIVQALKLTEGNKKEAARLLNLKRTTLLEKIKKKEIDGDWLK